MAFGIDGMASWIHESLDPYRQVHKLNEISMSKDTNYDNIAKRRMLILNASEL